MLFSHPSNGNLQGFAKLGFHDPVYDAPVRQGFHDPVYDESGGQGTAIGTVIRGDPQQSGNGAMLLIVAVVVLLIIINGGSND